MLNLKRHAESEEADQGKDADLGRFCEPIQQLLPCLGAHGTAVRAGVALLPGEHEHRQAE